MVVFGGRITSGQFPLCEGSQRPSSRADRTGMAAGFPLPSLSGSTSAWPTEDTPGSFDDRLNGWPGSGTGAGREQTESLAGRSRSAQTLPFRSRACPRFTLRRFCDPGLLVGRNPAACRSLLRSGSPLLERGSALRLPPRPSRPAASSMSAACPSDPAPATPAGPSCPASARCCVRRTPPGSGANAVGSSSGRCRTARA